MLSPGRDHAVPRAGRDIAALAVVGAAGPTPLHAGASQKALLAFLRPDESERIVTSPLEHRATPRSPTRAARDELAKIRTRGWASSYEETNLGVWGVAVPVVNARTRPCAVGIAAEPVADARARARRRGPRHEAATVLAKALGLRVPPVTATQRDHPGGRARRETEREDKRMSDQRPLGGKVALVTGAAKGTGGVVSDHLARDGADVALIGRDTAALEDHARLLDEKYPERRSAAFACDVTQEEEVAAMVAAVAARFGGIDILVNTAGGTGPIETPATDYPVEEFRAILDLNVVGTFLPCKHAAPHMITRGGGRIVNLAGTSGLRGYRNRSGYSSSKWAVRGLTRTLALELGPHDITVNTVCPNVTHGGRMDKIVATKAERLGTTPEQVYADFAAQTALGRFVEEEDIAAAIDFLVSAGAKNITGHDIPVDAGWDV